MTVQAIAEKIEKLESELAALKSEIRQLQAGGPVKTTADLYGIFKGKLSFSEEEIKAAEYKFDVDKYMEKYG